MNKTVVLILLLSVSQHLHTFHSHPSGETETLIYTQYPSEGDIDAALGTSYVIAKRERKVYVYDHSGILATIPERKF